MVQVTLDKSQSTGVHEKAILQSDVAKDPEGYVADFAVGQSDTHQISRTKGGVFDGIVALEGSTTGRPRAKEPAPCWIRQSRAGVQAQNNTLSVYVNTYKIAKFSARSDYEHGVAARQMQAAAARS